MKNLSLIIVFFVTLNCAANEQNLILPQNIPIVIKTQNPTTLIINTESASALSQTIQALKTFKLQQDGKDCSPITSQENPNISVDLSSCIPEKIKLISNLKQFLGGPNCHNSWQYLNGFLEALTFTDYLELEYNLQTHCRKLENKESRQAGDIIVFNEVSFGIDPTQPLITPGHSALYLHDNLLWEKPTMRPTSEYGFKTVQNDFYFQKTNILNPSIDPSLCMQNQIDENQINKYASTISEAKCEVFSEIYRCPTKVSPIKAKIPAEDKMLKAIHAIEIILPKLTFYSSTPLNSFDWKELEDNAKTISELIPQILKSSDESFKKFLSPKLTSLEGAFSLTEVLGIQVNMPSKPTPIKLFEDNKKILLENGNLICHIRFSLLSAQLNLTGKSIPQEAHDCAQTINTLREKKSFEGMDQE